MAKPSKGPHQELLTSSLDYDPETGVFKRKAQASWAKIGDVAGCLRPDGYLKVSLGGRSYLCHRLAYQYATGGPPPEGLEIDHINGVKTDNRIANLRAVTRRTNQENWIKPSKRKKSSEFLGVTAKNGKFIASITVNRKVYRIGSFDTGEEAYEAYLLEKRKRHRGCTI